MDERRNESYCMDLTAYEAIRNIERKQRNMDIIKQGEIWGADGGRKCVVLAVDEKVCSVLLLHDESRSENDIELKRSGERYTNPSMVSYKYKNLFEYFVEAIPEDEFKYIQSMVKRALGLNDAADITTPMKQYDDEEMKELMRMYDELKENCDHLSKLNSSIEMESEKKATKFIRMEAERDFWKQQAECYLERLLDS